MPIEIRELVIKAYVDDDNAASNSNRGAQESNTREEIIADCMEQISELLKDKLER